MKPGFALAGILLAGLVIGGGAPQGCVVQLGDGPRRVVAGELVEGVIRPTYDDVVTTAQALAAAAHAFDAAPDQITLDALQAAWRAARVPWKQTDAFRFGPLSLQTLATAIDQFPVDPAKIDIEIAGTATLDAAYFASLGANKQGFHAIEYLVFGPDDASVLAAHADPRRRAYVAGAADRLAANATALRDAWQARGSLLADPGADNMDYPTIKASIDALVNESVFQVEVIADARLGKPAGTGNGGTIQPELQESEPSENSIDDMIHALDSVRNIYLGSRDGSDAGGISRLVAAQSPATDREVRDQLAFAAATLRSIPRPYTHALTTERHLVIAAYMAIQDLQHLYATEVIATLGATLKFNDNDGD